MKPPVRVIQYGLGPIGRAMARHVVERAGLELVGAVDVDVGLVGREVGEVIGLERPLGFAVDPTLAQTLARTPADVALHTTRSHLSLVQHELLEILGAGLDLISTAEELSFPWLAHDAEAAAIDAAARRAGKTALGTGVNPGFVMDTLPLFLTGICQRVDSISVTRVINASRRRGPFQTKIGSGLTVAEFQARTAQGQVGHVGLSESMHMLFTALGRELERYESTVEPVVADRLIRTQYVEVQPGQVCGLKQVARGFTRESEFVTLTFVAALDAEQEGDVVQIRGRPDLEVTLRGTNGDLATVAIAVNAIPRVMAARPGLLTMSDLPIVTHWLAG